MKELIDQFKSESNKLFPFAAHLLFVSLLYFLLYQLGEIKQLPNNSNITQWDAGIYQDIKFNGYNIDIDEKSGNTGFFPLFPYVWKISNLSSIGIAIFNLSLFFFCMQWLMKIFAIPNKIVLIYLSIPSLIFFFVPYSESLFFLSSTLILVGWKKQSYWLIIFGCIISCISRPSFLYFIPTIIFIIFYLWKENQLSRNNKLILLLTLFAIIIGFSINLFLYDKFTGESFAFFQMRRDGNSFSLPVFPLTTWRGAKLLWLDGTALIICMATSITCLGLLLSKYFKKIEAVKEITTLFSLGFISVIIIHILFFNIKDPSGGTSLLGLNRFVFATPFFLLTLNHYWKPMMENVQYKYSTLLLILIGLGILGVYLPSNFPDHLRPAIYISIIALFWVYRNVFKNIWIVIYLMQSILQVLTLSKYLQGFWIG